MPHAHLPMSPMLERALRASWSAETCDDVDVGHWRPDNPARGQCGVTALVVQDHLGGELLLAEVSCADGSRQGVHYWNRLPSGEQVDLTRTQFDAGERIGSPRVQRRPPGLASTRLAVQYDRLRRAVDEQLAAAGPEARRD